MFDNLSDGPVERYPAAIEGAAMAGWDALSPEVTLDATVPNWPFNVRGDATVRAELSRWYAGRITRDQVWSGRRWSVTLLAEMAEAADATT